MNDCWFGRALSLTRAEARAHAPSRPRQKRASNKKARQVGIFAIVLSISMRRERLAPLRLLHRGHPTLHGLLH
jgi:hypothetical protein